MIFFSVAQEPHGSVESVPYLHVLILLLWAKLPHGIRASSLGNKDFYIDCTPQPPLQELSVVSLVLGQYGPLGLRDVGGRLYGGFHGRMVWG